MIISKIMPHGFCGGVINAIKISNEVLDNPNTVKPIYILGRIIHNEKVCRQLEDKGAIIIREDLSRLEMVDLIDNGTVIISAHGASEQCINKCINKGLHVIDTTCKFVKIIEHNIRTQMQKRKIIYFGVKNHPECEAILGISDQIILITNYNQLISLPKNEKYYLTNQTTLSMLKLKSWYEYVEKNFSDVIIDNKICSSTTRRQQAVLDTKADLIIVAGDSKSSNTLELYKLATKFTNALLVNDYLDLINIDLNIYQTIALTSGASTPEYVLNEIYEYLTNTYN